MKARASPAAWVLTPARRAVAAGPAPITVRFLVTWTWAWAAVKMPGATRMVLLASALASAAVTADSKLVKALVPGVRVTVWFGPGEYVTLPPGAGWKSAAVAT